MVGMGCEGEKSLKKQKRGLGVQKLTDITERLSNEIKRRKQAEQTLKERLIFEELISDLSARFINLPADQVDDEIENAQRLVCECLGLDLSALWQWSDETPRIITLTHLYRPLGGPTPPEPMYAHEHFPWCWEQLDAGRTVVVSSMDKLPAEAARDQEVWRHFGIKTTLTFPLSHGGGRPIGALSFNDMLAERTWTEPLIQRLQLVAQMFTNALVRKQNETVLRDSEARLLLITEAVGAGLWIMDVATKKVWVSPKSRELFHFDPNEEIHYERYFRVIHPEDRDRVHQAVQQALRFGEDLHCDYRIVLPDGNTRWIGARGRWFQKSTGEPERILGLSFDITEQKEMELQLKRSQASLYTLINSTSDMIWSVDAEHFGLLTFNRGLYEYFLHGGIGLHIEAGMTPEDLLPTEEYAQKWRMFYRRALEEGSFTTEYPVYTGKRTLRLNFNVLKNDDRVFGVSVFGQDITERKRSEEAVRESELKYRNLYESMMDGYVLAGMDGLILKYNEAYREMTGYTHDELLRLTYHDITPEKWHNSEQRIVEQQVLTRGYSEVYEKEYRKKDGTVFPVELRTFLLKDEGGDNIGLWAIARDITSRKLIESETRKLREDLAHVTRVSTLGGLTSSLAHEINQPLTAILSNAQAAHRFLLQDHPDMKEISEILGDIIRDDNRAAEVIRKIRSLLKKEELRYESLSLNDVIEEILNVIRNDTALTAVSIEKEFDPSLTPIWGDRIQLQQVILNLILNAAEAMRDTSIDPRRLIVRTSKKDGRFAEVAIRDVGTGIKENNAGRLFDSFYTTKSGGLGMGLAISKDIVKSHKGEIRAENNPDIGATFSFTVPFDNGVRL